MFKRDDFKVRFLELQRTLLANRFDKLKDTIDTLNAQYDEFYEHLHSNAPDITKEHVEAYFSELIDYKSPSTEDDDVFENSLSIQEIINDNDSRYFLIQDSVYKCAELIKITENFTGRTLKDIHIGKYTYLMGKSKMVRFYCGIGYIKGYYWDNKENISFDFRIAMRNGNYYFPNEFSKEFTQIMQVLTFVELGDIEIVQLEGGRNNGKSKSDGKIHNSSNYTIYVVDSTWNKLIIRTEGFAVRGHFRLQPCGPNHIDRKLTWIDAFEKHGYTRKPKAEIVK